MSSSGLRRVARNFPRVDFTNTVPPYGGYGFVESGLPAGVEPTVRIRFADLGSISDTRGNAVPTFTRATVATLSDQDGVVRYARSGEVRFQGLRRVENLIPTNTEVLSPANNWNVGSALNAQQVNSPDIPAPDGTFTATKFKVNDIAGNRSFGTSFAFTPTNRTIRWSYWVWVHPANTGLSLLTYAFANGEIPADTFNLNSLPRGQWVRISYTHTYGGAALSPINPQFVANGAATLGDIIYVWHPQFEDVTGQVNTNPAEYVSFGVQSAPIYHGAGVDGVKYFPKYNNNVVQQNLWDHSQALENAAWSAVNTTKSGNIIAAPDGTVTACKIIESLDGAPLSHILVSPGWTSTLSTYTFSVYAKAGERSQIQLGISSSMIIGTGANARFTLTGIGLAENLNNCDLQSIQFIGNGWYRCSMTFTPTAIAAVGSFIYLSNGAGLSNYIGDGVSGAYLWGAQLQSGRRASTYVPTILAAITGGIIEEAVGDTIPAATRRGFYSEGSRANKCIFSQALDNASWTKVNTSVNPDVSIGPDGTLTMDKIVENVAVTVPHYVQSTAINITAGSTITHSVFIKAGERTRAKIEVRDNTGANGFTVDFNMNTSTFSGGLATGTGTFISADFKAFPFGIFRILLIGKVGPADVTAVARTYTLDNTGARDYTGDGISGIYATGEQLEEAAFSSTYIPTAAVAVTRNSDLLIYTTSSWLNLVNGALYADFFLTFFGVATNSTYAAGLNHGGGNPAAAVRLNGISIVPQFRSLIGGASDIGGLKVPTIETRNKCICAWDNSGANVYGATDGGLNGNNIAWNNATLDTLYVGSAYGGTPGELFGQVAEVTCYSTPLTPAVQIALVG